MGRQKGNPGWMAGPLTLPSFHIARNLVMSSRFCIHLADQSRMASRIASLPLA